MDNKEFIDLVLKEVVKYNNSHNSELITIDDVYVVWSCKALQNNKALAATTLRDGLYFEVTYNGDKGECYIDVYRKVENYVAGNPNNVHTR